eukprot:TRINITY_DN1317_c0_g1_i5.p1 TRINITY_DN1317_c0_g1~~TRINITY_DN1317_c0_g1_i5.p1  ORF type:complete len:242 (-),score=35.50 TRINITY_DN1317_c0_g1_i5:229-954(-)
MKLTSATELYTTEETTDSPQWMRQQLELRGQLMSLKRLAYWPKMDRDMRYHWEYCADCLRVKGQKAIDTARALLTGWIPVYGIPELIITDPHPGFASSVMDHLGGGCGYVPYELFSGQKAKNPADMVLTSQMEIPKVMAEEEKIFCGGEIAWLEFDMKSGDEVSYDGRLYILESTEGAKYSSKSSAQQQRRGRRSSSRKRAPPGWSSTSKEESSVGAWTRWGTDQIKESTDAGTDIGTGGL